MCSDFYKYIIMYILIECFVPHRPIMFILEFITNVIMFLLFVWKATVAAS